DQLARELRIDPLELREINGAKEGTKAAHGPTWVNIGYQKTLEAAKASEHLNTPLRPGQGRGIASGYWHNAGGESSAACHINEDGTVTVTEGHPDIGGARPSVALVVAEVRGVPFEGVRPVVGDTTAIRSSAPHGDRGQISGRGQGPGFTTHICEVEVDRETGYVKILRYTAIQDVGRAIHPSYVEGQMQGGVAQGIGWALNEEYVYDKDGRLENPGYLDYRMPVASDLPMIEAVIVEV